MIVVGLVFLRQPGVAQKKPTAGTPDQTRRVLIDKARALEARGRPDMAIQLWQQILLSDPKNTDALSGLAKDYKLIGSSAQADQALERLRKITPNDPNIGKIAGMTSTRAQSDRLRQAGELARQGKAVEAMAIYRELYGDHPPDGDIALAYYQTLYGTPLGKQEAVTAMRALAQRNPGDTRFGVELGRMLTYDAKTRAEGMRVLREYPKDSTAQAALRQALVWDASNPASSEQLRQYLKDHPQDAELAGHLKENEAKLAEMNSGIARTPAERAAFAALNAHRLQEAETRFAALLEQEPQNGRAAAGMGFLRMQQNNFGDAVRYLSQAETNGYKAASITEALATARFWFTMREASQAFDENQADVATAKYKEALAMRPRSPEALNGLAGLLVREQQYSQAAGIYDQLTHVQPGSSDGWRGLFLAYARDGQNDRAMAVVSHLPASVKPALAKDPEYLRTLATVYHAQNRPADAQRVLAQALALPFPDNGTNLKSDTRLQYAGILMEAHRFAQAEELYTQALQEDPSNLPAWMGLVSADHELREDAEALADVQKMPPATYEAALADPGFLSMLGGMYAQANQFEIAQGLLERSAKIQMASGGQLSIPLQLQLAGIYLQRNDTAQAYEIYRRVLATHPDRVDAWKGLIGALQVTNRNSEALGQIAAIPPAVRRQLDSDIEFLQTEASLYAAAGDTPHAVDMMNRVQAHYATLKQQPPASVEVQNAWLLFNTKNDRALYPALMRLGGRQDLTNAQREDVQTIWASWSVRRAGAAMDNGNMQRASDILDAASQAFPDNLAVRKAVAGGYARVGRAKEAVALYKAIPMQDAAAGDFQGAVGAALAANDKAQAELWLRQGLERYPKNPGILQLAARFEQARGDNQRAADYYRASLAAMPQASAADRLAHELVYPDQDNKARRAVTAADLQHLLDPNYEPFPKTTKVPPLPAYGNDPYNPGAPVVLARPQQTPEIAAAPAVPAVQPLPAPQEQGSAAASAYTPQASVSAQPPQAPARARGKGARTYEGRMNLPASQPIATAPAAPPVTTAPADQLGLGVAPLAHTLTTDAWKGLIGSLASSNRTADAFQEIAKIPADVRQQLEDDPEFVQIEAQLDAANGDIPHATECMNRVQNYYLLRRTAPPAPVAVQGAWVLFNTRNDRDLYPLLRRLDARQDLTADQRQQVQSIWVNWSLRRASAAMEAGDIQAAVDVLDAASRDYPDDLAVRRAVAGAYARVGRADEALRIYKNMPMQDATGSEYQGAIAAAIAARDLAQAESWLRQALGRYPQDPAVLSIAARYEQARGNDQRATDYWRAALAAMPPGASTRGLAGLPIYPQQQGGVRNPASGDLKQLLNPANQPAGAKQPPLPSYGHTSAASPRSAESQPNPWQSGRATVPAPPAPPAAAPAPTETAINPQAALRDNVPVYIPQSGSPAAPRVPTFTEQSHNQPLAADGRTVRRPDPTAGLRLSSKPAGPVADAQTLFADQTDSQLTDGHAIRPLGNVPVQPVTGASGLPAREYDMAQYTPSAQEAATGAYSAPRAQTSNPPASPLQSSTQPQAAPATPPSAPAKPAPTPRKSARPRATARASHHSSAPTLESAAPVESAAQQQPIPELPAEQTAPQPTSGNGLSDQELQDRNLPPLRGPWVRIQREQRMPSPRDEAETQLRSIESGYSGWVGGTGVINYRSGELGFDHLSALEAPFETSFPAGYAARFTVVAKPVFLDSGQADGSAITQMSTLGRKNLGTVPLPIGTLLATDTTPPSQQNASGIGGELQLAFSHFAMAAGYTPSGFLVSNVTGRVQWRPGNGPFLLNFVRDSVKDTQLSYSGLRDPGSASLSFPGNVWGGVMANQGGFQYAKGDAESGFYLGINGQYITGYNVLTNNRVDGDGGAYWRVLASPENGSLSIGVNFFGMHYAHNERAFTYGMGGYFSPQAYFLANVPFTWTGHSETHWHYNVMGSFGVQAFQEDLTALYPLVSTGLENSQIITVNGTQYNNLALPARTSVSANYDLRGSAAYQIGPHWFAGGFLSANNSRDYSAASAGFFVRYLFRSQPSTVAGPTGLFPNEGLRPFAVP